MALINTTHARVIRTAPPTLSHPSHPHPQPRGCREGDHFSAERHVDPRALEVGPAHLGTRKSPSIVVDHYHQPERVPYRRSAGTVTYGRALMGRASRENISCRGLRWDIFPLRSDYGSTSMAWVGLLKWAIYMWHSLLQV